MSNRLPDFLVIGGMRCGSTTLYNILAAHPQIFMPAQKELHFFDGYNPGLGEDIHAYQMLFNDALPAQHCGEVTPDYLTTPGSLERIADTFKQLKLVVILREPVARLCSHYMMSVAAGFEVLDFEAAIDSELQRLMQRNKIADIFHSYVERSTYLPRLLEYSQQFGRSNLHVIILEELSDHPGITLSKLWQFLEVDAMQENQVNALAAVTNAYQDIFREKQQNQTSRLRHFLKQYGVLTKPKINLPNISAKKKKTLTSHFASHNEQLSEWLGRPLPW